MKRQIDIYICDWCGKKLSIIDGVKIPQEGIQDLEICDNCSNLQSFSEGIARGIASSGKNSSQVMQDWLDLYQ